MRNQLIHVRRLPLGELSIAKPLEMLRQPHTGYVMELLTGMIPIKHLLSPPTGQVPNVEWYLRSGGLRQRLVLLGRVAHILSQLHGKGLAYSDPSPANIFISEDPSCSEVWLIDTDNLRYESAPGPLAAVCTPGYGAPELVQNQSGVTTLTDAYSFAIIAFQVLTLAHPFIGDLVNSGEPELEERAFSGHLPWIEDTEDTSNRASFGIPRKWVLSPRLEEAFRMTFCDGRLTPSARPGVSEWAHRLLAAADATLSCKSCDGSFYFNQAHCPWCDTPRPAYGVADFHLWDPTAGEGGVIKKPLQGSNMPKVVARSVLTSSKPFTITRRLAFGQMGPGAEEPVLKVLLNNAKLSLNSLDGNRYQIDLPSGGAQATISEKPRNLTLGEGQTLLNLHFGDKSCLHRVLHLNLKRGKKQ
jgi:DNA-binding helix-hairpin-helix protein with protein kinase domain